MEAIAKLPRKIRKIFPIQMVPLNYLSRNNPEERLAVFSFSYKGSKEMISVWRTGPGRPDPSEEEWVAKSRMPSSRSFTL